MNENQPLPETLPADADTINAIVDAMGALVICLAKRMPAEDKTALARDLRSSRQTRPPAGGPRWEGSSGTSAAPRTCNAEQPRLAPAHPGHSQPVTAPGAHAPAQGQPLT